MAFCRSAARGGQVALPLAKGADEIKALQRSMPDDKVILSMEANAKEYAG